MSSVSRAVREAETRLRGSPEMMRELADQLDEAVAHRGVLVRLSAAYLSGGLRKRAAELARAAPLAKMYGREP